MREVISVHVGQAGVQIGNACCEYFVLLSCTFISTLTRFDASFVDIVHYLYAMSVAILTCIVIRGIIYS